jgi:hypothetical protein
MPESVFQKYVHISYPYWFRGTIRLKTIAGGYPTDATKAEAWLKHKAGIDSAEVLRKLVARIMLERGVSPDEAIAEANVNYNLNGFPKDPVHGLWHPGRCLKAGLKEWANIAWPWPKHKWNQHTSAKTGNAAGGKGSLSYVAEHVFVQEERMFFGRAEPDEIEQRFKHLPMGRSAIGYEEVCRGVELTFTVATDHEFTEDQWGRWWSTGEQNGLGSSRSLGHGRFTVIAWDPVEPGTAAMDADRVPDVRDQVYLLT